MHSGGLLLWETRMQELMTILWALGIVAVGALVAAVALYVFRTRMDPDIKDRADRAWLLAAEIKGCDPKGSTPPVQLKPAPWMIRGVEVIGNYKPVVKVWKWVLLDRILVVDAWHTDITLVHEMTHALRRRLGEPSSEKAAEAAEEIAREREYG